MESREFIEEVSHSSTCDHLQEMVIFDSHDFRQQLDGKYFSLHDDAAVFMDTNTGTHGHKSNLRVDLADILQQLHHWKASQSEQHMQLMSRLEDLSTTFSGMADIPPTETCLNALDIAWQQDDGPAAIYSYAQNISVRHDEDRFLKLKVLQPSLHVQVGEQTSKKSDIPVPPPEFPLYRIEDEDSEMMPIKTASWSSINSFHQLYFRKRSTGHVSSASSEDRRLDRLSVDGGVNDARDRRRSQKAFMLNVALHEDSYFDLPSMYPANRRMSIIGSVGCIRAYSQLLLRTLWWDFFIALTIISYAAYMGFQVDWAVRNVGVLRPIAHVIIDFVYTFVFTVELMLRIIVEGLHFWSFYNAAFYWNYLDALIVATSLTESSYDAYWLWLHGSTAESHAMGMDSRQLRIIRVIRTVRILKIFRIARLIRFVRALRTLIFSIVHTLKSVVWALVLLFFFIYVVAVILTGAMSEHKRSSGCDGSASLCKYWGDLPKAMLSLFSAVCGGISWYDIVTPMLQHLHPIWTGFFLAYVCFVYFAVLNVITGVFCESAIESAKTDVEVAIREAVDKKSKYIKKLEKLFSWIDTDGSDEITLAELETYMTQELSGAFFQILELEVDYPDEILRLIDTDHSGQISKDEFIDGVCRLRGPATALQIAQLGYALSEQIDGLLNHGGQADGVKECKYAVHSVSTARRNGEA